MSEPPMTSIIGLPSGALEVNELLLTLILLTSCMNRPKAGRGPMFRGLRSPVSLGSRSGLPEPPPGTVKCTSSKLTLLTLCVASMPQSVGLQLSIDEVAVIALRWTPLIDPGGG